ASRSSLQHRVRQKINLLESLRDSGIWLVDASIAALYTPARPKPNARIQEAAMHRSWDGYTGAVVAEAQPEAIICIGKGVQSILRSRLDRLRIPWITVPQPNARLSRSEHFAAFEIYRRV